MKAFDNKLEELVSEFNTINTIGLHEFSIMHGNVGIRAKGENHFNDFFICLNFRAISSVNMQYILPYLVKYDGKLGLHPVKDNNTLCIRINSSQFKLK